ncbi:MAG: glycosyltransferase [Methylocella sp.]
MPLNRAAPTVAIVVPVRDEAANIRPCVSSLIAQTYPMRRLQVVVVDDHSRDETASIVATLERKYSRLALLHSPPLPAGWTGKSHACWTGSRAAPAETDWLCFVDADVRAEPLMLVSALSLVEAKHLDFLSLTPRQELVSFAERLLMPCGLYLLAFRQDLIRIQAPESGEATATGQFILVRRAAYEKLGGHAAVRSEICEDVALARLARRSGLRVALAGGDRLLRTRMYTGWHTLWLGVSKNLVDMMGGLVSAGVIAILGAVVPWAAVALPPLDAIGCMRASNQACLALAAALPASTAAFGFHIAGAAFFRIPLWYGLMFPLGYTVGAMIAVDSVRRRLTGRISWKGRVYP